MEKKKPGCLYNFFYGFLMILSLFVGLFFVVWAKGIAVLGIVPFFAIFYFCYIKLTIVKIHHFLCKPGKRFMKFTNLLACFLFFNLVLIASVLYIYNISQVGIADSSDHTFIQFISIAAKTLCWYIAVMILWMQYSNILILGIEAFPKNVFTFAVKYVPIYLLYQVATFIVLLVGDGIISLASGGENEFMSRGFSFFLFDCTPSDISFSGLLGNLTSSSSYVVLAALGLDFLKSNKTENFKQRVSMVVDGGDTKRMLIMTVICIAATLVTKGSVSLQGFSLAGGIPKEATATLVVLAILAIMWIISTISFIKTTNLFEYFTTLIIMIFIEAVIPIPDISWKTLVLAIFCIVLRVVLFIAVSMLSAMLTKAYEDNNGISVVEVSDETKEKLGAAMHAVSVAIERKKAFDSALNKFINKK